MKLEVKFSKQVDLERVKYTIEKIEWFRAQKYNVDLPKKISGTNSIENLSDENLMKLVSEEYDEKTYREIEKSIHSKWEDINECFGEKLKKMNLPVMNNYEIFLSKYGVGGSYNLPNGVVLNINSKKDLVSTIIHEIIHLTIENLITENNIEHWTKERIVDLICREFYPEKNFRVQRDPLKSDDIYKIFKDYFPDIKKLIKQLSKLD